MNSDFTFSEQVYSAFYGVKNNFGVALGVPLSLVLLNACATPKPKVKVIQTIHPDCAITEEKRVTQGKDIVGEYNTLAGFNDSCADLQILSLIAKTRENDTVGVLSGIALLHMLANKNEAIRNAVILAIHKEGKRTEDLVRAEILYLLHQMQDGKGKEKSRAAQDLLIIHRGLKYQHLGEMPQQILAQEMAFKNLTIQDVEKALVSNRKQQLLCWPAVRDVGEEQTNVRRCRKNQVRLPGMHRESLHHSR